jgi:tetratricopeptide (TPR) repeat protein
MGAAAAQAPIALAGLAPFAALPLYARLLLWPSHLFMGHAVSASGAQAFGGIAFFAAAICFVLRDQTQKTLPISFGIVWFFAAFVPSFCAGNIVFEHWMYLPTAGLFLGAAGALPQNGKLLIPAFFLALLLGVLTWNQNEIWRDPETFYTHIIASGDPAPNAHSNLGVFYANKGDTAAALKEYALAEKDFARTTDTFTANGRAALETDIAAALFAQGGAAHRDEALDHLKKAIEIDPDYYFALDKLATYYRQRGEATEAARYQSKADALARKFGAF